ARPRTPTAPAPIRTRTPVRCGDRRWPAPRASAAEPLPAGPTGRTTPPIHTVTPQPMREAVAHLFASTPALRGRLARPGADHRRGRAAWPAVARPEECRRAPHRGSAGGCPAPADTVVAPRPHHPDARAGRPGPVPVPDDSDAYLPINRVKQGAPL